MSVSVSVSAPVSAPVCVSVSVAPRKDIDTARSRNDIFHRAHPLTFPQPTRVERART